MDGRPEGTGTRVGRARPRWLVVVVAAFAVYLGIRLVQGVVWAMQALFW